MIFVDTSAFFALIYAEEPRHREAKEKLESLLERGESLITHNYVLVESFALFHARLGYQSARAFYRDVYHICQILWVSQTQHERAAKTYVGQTGPPRSFVDCVSFEIMKTRGIRRCFAFDDDFQRAGFDPV